MRGRLVVQEHWANEENPVHASSSTSKKEMSPIAHSGGPDALQDFSSLALDADIDPDGELVD